MCKYFKTLWMFGRLFWGLGFLVFFASSIFNLWLAVQCSQWEVEANMLRAGREVLGCVLLTRRGWALGFFLSVTCVGGNYSVDSGTNKLAGVFKSVFFSGLCCSDVGFVSACDAVGYSSAWSWQSMLKLWGCVLWPRWRGDLASCHLLKTQGLSGPGRGAAAASSWCKHPWASPPIPLCMSPQFKLYR